MEHFNIIFDYFDCWNHNNQIFFSLQSFSSEFLSHQEIENDINEFYYENKNYESLGLDVYYLCVLHFSPMDF